MEKNLMYRIYNTLFDSKKELNIEDIKIFENWEGKWVIKYKCEGEEYLITNEFICI